MASIVQISTSRYGVIFEGDPLSPKATEALASIRDELADEGSRPTQPIAPSRCACGSDRLLYEIPYPPSVGVEDQGRQSWLCQGCGSRIWIDPPSEGSR